MGISVAERRAAAQTVSGLLSALREASRFSVYGNMVERDKLWRRYFSNLASGRLLLRRPVRLPWLVSVTYMFSTMVMSEVELKGFNITSGGLFEPILRVPGLDREIYATRANEAFYLGAVDLANLGSLAALMLGSEEVRRQLVDGEYHVEWDSDYGEKDPDRLRAFFDELDVFTSLVEKVPPVSLKPVDKPAVMFRTSSAEFPYMTLYVKRESSGEVWLAIYSKNSVFQRELRLHAKMLETLRKAQAFREALEALGTHCLRVRDAFLKVYLKGVAGVKALAASLD